MQLPVVEIFTEMFLHFSKILFAQTLSLPGKVRDAGRVTGGARFNARGRRTPILDRITGDCRVSRNAHGCYDWPNSNQWNALRSTGIFLLSFVMAGAANPARRPFSLMKGLIFS